MFSNHIELMGLIEESSTQVEQSSHYKSRNMVLGQCPLKKIAPDRKTNPFFAMKALIHKRTLPLENLLAVLSDSSSTMCGTVTDLEMKLRGNLAPHLLDINGRSFHHMHNMVKKFTLFFDYFLDNLLRYFQGIYVFC